MRWTEILENLKKFKKFEFVDLRWTEILENEQEFQLIILKWFVKWNSKKLVRISLHYFELKLKIMEWNNHFLIIA